MRHSRSVANEHGHARLGIATPKKYGDAVRRNRFRRLTREAFRALAARLPSRDLLIEPRRDLVEPTLDGLKRDFALACGTPLPFATRAALVAPCSVRNWAHRVASCR